MDGLIILVAATCLVCASRSLGVSDQSALRRWLLPALGVVAVLFNRVAWVPPAAAVAVCAGLVWWGFTQSNEKWSLKRSIRRGALLRSWVPTPVSGLMFRPYELDELRRSGALGSPRSEIAAVASRLMELGQMDRAAARLERAGKNSGESGVLLSLSLLAIGDPARALETLEDLNRRGQVLPKELWWNIAALHHRMGERTSAARALATGVQEGEPMCSAVTAWNEMVRATDPALVDDLRAQVAQVFDSTDVASEPVTTRTASGGRSSQQEVLSPLLLSHVAREALEESIRTRQPLLT